MEEKGRAAVAEMVVVGVRELALCAKRRENMAAVATGSEELLGERWLGVVFVACQCRRRVYVCLEEH